MSKCSVVEDPVGTFTLVGTEWNAACAAGQHRKTKSAETTAGKFTLTTTPERECVADTVDAGKADNCKEYIKNAVAGTAEIQCTECDKTGVAPNETDAFTLKLAYTTGSGYADA